MLIDGVLGICKNCGGEIMGDRHFVATQIDEEGVTHISTKHSCNEIECIHLAKEDARALKSWLRVRAGNSRKLTLSPSEKEYLRFCAQLALIHDVPELVIAWTRASRD